MVKTEEFKSHVVWNTLADLQSRVEGDLHLRDAEDRYHAQRIHSVAEYVDALRDSDPVLLEPQFMQDLYAHLQQILNALDAYLKNPDAQQYLASAASSVANVTAVVRQHVVPFSPDEAHRAAKAASTRYRNSLDAEVERLKGEVDAMRVGLAKEKTEREQEARAVAAQQQAAEDASSERLAVLSETIAERERRIEALELKLSAQIDQQRNAFEVEAASRAAAFKESETLREDSESERLEAAKESSKTAREAQDHAAQKLMDALETYKSQAAALVDTTSRHAIAGDYGTWASNQATAAFRWTVVTVVIGIATVAGLIYAVGSAANDSIQFTVYKTSISVIGLIVAGYCARQAAEHRKEERTAKRLALDLAALEPFLEQIDDPKELREEIARRVFVPERQSGGEGEGSVRTKRGSMSITEVTELLTAVRGSNAP